MTLSEIIITASITAVIIGPGSWLFGYRTAMYDSPRTMTVWARIAPVDLQDDQGAKASMNVRSLIGKGSAR